MQLEWHSKTIGPMTWDEAVRYCESLGDRWRMPTDIELCSVIDRSLHNPATRMKGFKPVNYWSSTTYKIYCENAWYVNFFDGNIFYNHKSSTCYVRAVRNGKKEVINSF